MSEPTTEAGKRHSRWLAFGDDLGEVSPDEIVAEIEAEAHADADAQIAALREALGGLYEASHFHQPYDDPDTEYALDHAEDYAAKVLADTQSAAKAHDAALVKPWREALEWFVDFAAAGSESYSVAVKEQIDKARALLRDTEQESQK